MRRAFLPALLSLTLALAACGTPGTDPEAEPEVDGVGSPEEEITEEEPEPEVSVADSSIDRLAAALPDVDDLPDGAQITGYCPGGSACLPWQDPAEEVGVSASLQSAADDGWMSDSVALGIARYPDAGEASERLDLWRDTTQERVGDFTLEPEETDGGFIPGQEGTGTFGDTELGEWSGHVLSGSTIYSDPSGGTSEQRHFTELTLVNSQLVLTCQTTRSEEDSGAAAQLCEDLTGSYLERLEASPADPDAVFMTPARLIESLPPDEDFSADTHHVGIRCPGDSACEDQDQVASISVYLPLPDGVDHDEGARVSDDLQRFRIPGGEAFERVWLRAWLEPTETAAAEAIQERADEFDVGDLDTEPVETESGYTFGRNGEAALDDVEFGAWSGVVHSFEGTMEHLDGRVVEPRVDVVILVERDRALVRVDGSFTVEGRNREDALESAQEFLEGYLQNVDEVGSL